MFWTGSVGEVGRGPGPLSSGLLCWPFPSCWITGYPLVLLASTLGRRQGDWERFVVNIWQLIVIVITGLFMHRARSCRVIWVLVRVIRDPKPVVITVRRNFHIIVRCSMSQ